MKKENPEGETVIHKINRVNKSDISTGLFLLKRK